MIVDLVRNDLGRLARTGTVRVPRLGVCEPFGAGLAVELGGRGVAPGRDRSRRRADGAVPERVDHRRAQAGGDGRDRRARGRAARRVLRRGRLGGSAGRAGARPLRCRDPHRGRRPARRPGALRRRRRDHHRLRAGRGVRRAAGQGPGARRDAGRRPARAARDPRLRRRRAAARRAASRPGGPVGRLVRDPAGRRRRTAGVAGRCRRRSPDARLRLRVSVDGAVAVDVQLAAAARSVGRCGWPSTRCRSTRRRCGWRTRPTGARSTTRRGPGTPAPTTCCSSTPTGHVTESCIANVLACLDGRWWTPPTTDGCLPGIGREVLLAERRRDRALPHRRGPAARRADRAGQLAARPPPRRPALTRRNNSFVSGAGGRAARR